MIIQAIGNGNVVLALSANQAMALMNYLDLGVTEEETVMVSEGLQELGVCVSPRNVWVHLEAIRAGLDDRIYDLYPHLLEAAELEVEFEAEDDTEPNKKPVIIH